VQESITELRMDGGAAANDDLVQLHADFTHCITSRPACLETTALGAAALAGLATGFFTSIGDIAATLRKGRSVCVPYSTDETRRQREEWRRLVSDLDRIEKTGYTS